jgi:hypothetical protein
MPEITAPALFWLDGHYCGGMTARGDCETPVLAELEQVMTAWDLGHLIIIDDARDFGRNPDYPSLEEVQQWLTSKGANVCMTVEADMIRITPGARFLELMWRV